MKKALPFLAALIAINCIIVSCNKSKNNSTSSDGTTSNEKTELAKEDKSSKRIKVVDSIFNVAKNNSPYPKDFEVLSVKEMDSITPREMSNLLVKQAKKADKGTGGYIEPEVLEKIKKFGEINETYAFIYFYNLRYRVSDNQILVKNFIMAVQTRSNAVLENVNVNTYNQQERDFITKQVAWKLQTDMGSKY